MSGDTEDRRRALAVELLSQLKNVGDHLRRITDDLGDSSQEYLNKVYEDHSGKIKEKVDQFNQNVEKVKNLNVGITSSINEWYQFTKNEKELSSLFFPLRLYFMRKRIKSKIKEHKAEITNIGIKNRLIVEDIQRLESNLEYEASARLKKDVRYQDYVAHLETKARLIEEIRYLIPTIPGLSIKEIQLDRLNEAIEQISAKQAPERG